MAVFNNVHTISVWLESDRFANNSESMTTEDYVAMALDFEARDKRMLKGRNVTVEYIDYDGTVHHRRLTIELPPEFCHIGRLLCDIGRQLVTALWSS